MVLSSSEMASSTGKVSPPCEADPLVLNVTLAEDDGEREAGYPGRFTRQVRILHYLQMPGQRVQTLPIIIGLFIFDVCIFSWSCLSPCFSQII